MSWRLRKGLWFRLILKILSPPFHNPLKMDIDNILEELNERIKRYKNNKFYNYPHGSGYSIRLKAELHASILECESIKKFILRNFADKKKL